MTMVSNLFILGLLLFGFNSGLAQESEVVEQAKQLMMERKYPQAREVLQKALEAQPEDPKILYLSGLCLLELKEYQLAEASFVKVDQVLKSAPDSEASMEEPRRPRADQVLVGLARVHMGKEDLDKAAITLNEAEKLRADNPELHYHRGMLHARRKDYAGSAKSLERSIELNPENAYAYYYAGLAYNQIRRPDKMLEHFRTFLKLAPEAPEAAKVRALLRGIR
jgi:tetratricopeptide (TPR) repeat protein